jgi:phospholipase D1/2
MEMELLNG